MTGPYMEIATAAIAEIRAERDAARAMARRYHEWLCRIADFRGDGSTLTVLAAERAGRSWLAEGVEE